MQAVLRKLQYILLISFVFSMPFSLGEIKLNSYLIILLTVNSFLLFFLSKEKHKYAIHRVLILFILVYLMHLFGLFKTDNFHEAIFELQKKLSILLLPNPIILATVSL